MYISLLLVHIHVLHVLWLQEIYNKNISLWCIDPLIWVCDKEGKRLKLQSIQLRTMDMDFSRIINGEFCLYNIRKKNYDISKMINLFSPRFNPCLCFVTYVKSLKRNPQKIFFVIIFSTFARCIRFLYSRYESPLSALFIYKPRLWIWCNRQQYSHSCSTE